MYWKFGGNSSNTKIDTMKAGWQWFERWPSHSEKVYGNIKEVEKLKSLGNNKINGEITNYTLQPFHNRMLSLITNVGRRNAFLKNGHKSWNFLCYYLLEKLLENRIKNISDCTLWKLKMQNTCRLERSWNGIFILALLIEKREFVI